MKDIGITGTRNSLNLEQLFSLREVLLAFYSISEQTVFHHGDCIGADDSGALIAKNIGYVTHSHPPTEEKFRAFFKSINEEKPKTYLERNRDIVDISEVLISIPRKEVSLKDILLCKNNTRRGGTYYTTRYALKNRKRVCIIQPNGYVLYGTAISNTETQVYYYGQTFSEFMRRRQDKYASHLHKVQ